MPSATPAGGRTATTWQPRAAKESARSRITEALETALRLADGLALLDVGPGREDVPLSQRSACIDCGVSLPEIAPRMFSFNNPAGACPDCDGLGVRQFFDPERIVHDPTLSLAAGAIRLLATGV